MRYVKIQDKTGQYVAMALMLLVVTGCSSPVYETPRIDPYVRALQPNESTIDRDGLPEDGTAAMDRPLSLDTCVAIALNRNPIRRAAEEGVAAVHAEVGVAHSAYTPTVDLQGGYSRWERHVFLPSGMTQSGMASTVGPSDDWLATLNLHFALFDSGKRRAELLTAMAQESASQQHVQEIRLDITLNVQKAYYAVLAAQEALEISEKNLARALNHWAIAKEKKAAGVIPDAEVIRVQVEVANDKLALVQAKGMARVTLGRLNAAMGLPVETAIQVENPPENTLAQNQMDVSDAMASARHARPELKAALDRIAAARSQVGAARSRFGPKVSLDARYGREDTTFFPNDKSWMTGLSVQIPVFDGQSRSHQVARAQAQLRIEEAQVQHLLLTVQEEVWTAHSQFLEAYEATVAAEAVLKAARESMRLAMERYKEGLATTNDLLDSETDLVRAEGMNTQTRWDYQTARAVLRRAIGKPLVFQR